MPTANREAPWPSRARPIAASSRCPSTKERNGPSQLLRSFFFCSQKGGFFVFLWGFGLLEHPVFCPSFRRRRGRRKQLAGSTASARRTRNSSGRWRFGRRQLVVMAAGAPAGAASATWLGVPVRPDPATLLDGRPGHGAGIAGKAVHMVAAPELNRLRIVQRLTSAEVCRVARTLTQSCQLSFFVDDCTTPQLSTAPGCRQGF